MADEVEVRLRVSSARAEQIATEAERIGVSQADVVKMALAAYFDGRVTATRDARGN